MSMNYTTLPDGSQQYQDPIRLMSKYWRYRNNDLRHVEPIVPPCVKRRINLYPLPCGKQRAEWYCELFNKKISVKDCHECQVSCPKMLTADPQPTNTPEGRISLPVVQVESPSQ